MSGLEGQSTAQGAENVSPRLGQAASPYNAQPSPPPRVSSLSDRGVTVSRGRGRGRGGMTGGVTLNREANTIPMTGGVTLNREPTLMTGGVTLNRETPMTGGVTLNRENPTAEVTNTATNLSNATRTEDVLSRIPTSPKMKMKCGSPGSPTLSRNTSCPTLEKTQLPQRPSVRPGRQVSESVGQRSTLASSSDIPAIAPPPGRTRPRPQGPLPTPVPKSYPLAQEDSLSWLIGENTQRNASSSPSPLTSPAASGFSSPASPATPVASPLTSSSGVAKPDSPVQVPPLSYISSSPGRTPMSHQSEPLSGPLAWLSASDSGVSYSNTTSTTDNTGYTPIGEEEKWWECATSPRQQPEDNWWDANNGTAQNPIADPPASTQEIQNKPQLPPVSPFKGRTVARPLSQAGSSKAVVTDQGDESPFASGKFKQVPPELPPVVDVSTELFTVHPYAPLGTVADVEPPVRWINDDYKEFFFGHDHYTFLGENVTSGESIVISVLRVPLNGSLLAIKITKRDHTLFNIKISDLKKVTIDFVGKIVQKNNPRNISKRNALILHNHLSTQFPGFSLEHVPEPEIHNSILKIEEKHSQNNKSFKIAFFYANGSEEAVKDYFDHKEGSPAYFNFLELLGTKVSLKGWTKYRGDFGADIEQDSYYTVWKDIEVMFHICLWMDAEQHRRLIGNDVVVIIFSDSAVPVVPRPLDALGTVPQVFVVVQPLPGDPDYYRLGVFGRPNIKTYDPILCQDIAVHKSCLKDHLFSKGLLQRKKRVQKEGKVCTK
eukprot:TRINITY_DN2871_c0_g1_i2.p1 TRINITY_DN2871_c0_g1~~TRINITY_DN2871_c0_g1_i2.p1  ORF type:complete len:773 (-),score=122.39 TRINITY_DN2871_c0_g1_i2:245-2563(-)